MPNKENYPYISEHTSTDRYTIYFMKVNKDTTSIPFEVSEEDTVYTRMDKLAWEKYGITKLSESDIHPSWKSAPKRLSNAIPVPPCRKTEDFKTIGICQIFAEYYLFTKPVNEVIKTAKWFNLDIQIIRNSFSLSTKFEDYPLDVKLIELPSVDNKPTYCVIDTAHFTKNPTLKDFYSFKRINNAFIRMGFTLFDITLKKCTDTDNVPTYTYNQPLNEAELIQKGKEFYLNITVIRQDTDNIPHFAIQPDTTSEELKAFFQTNFYQDTKVITRQHKTYRMQPILNDRYGLPYAISVYDAETGKYITNAYLDDLVDSLAAESEVTPTVNIGNLHIVLDEQNLEKYKKIAIEVMNTYGYNDIIPEAPLSGMDVARKTEKLIEKAYDIMNSKDLSLLKDNLPLKKNGKFARSKIVALYDNGLTTTPVAWDQFDERIPEKLMLCLVPCSRTCKNPFIDRTENTATLCIMPVGKRVKAVCCGQ